MLWHLEFYCIGSDGKRIGGEKVTGGPSSFDDAITKAKSMMRNVTFSFGKANICVIKSQDGSLVREVNADAPTV
jgi:hypothetical protein